MIKNLKWQKKSPQLLKAQCRVLKEELQDMKLQLNQLSEKIDSVPADVIDPVLTQQEINKKEQIILESTSNRTKTIRQLSKDENKFEKITDFIADFDITSYKEKSDAILKKKNQLSDLIEKMAELSDSKSVHVKKQDLLSEVPCGNKYPSCKFIKDAHHAGQLIQITESEMRDNAIQTNQLGAEIYSLEPHKVEDHMNKYDLLLEKKMSLASSIATSKLAIERADALIFREQVELENLKNKSKEYDQNKEAIENLKHLLIRLKQEQGLVKEKEIAIENCDIKIMKLHQKYGSLQEKLKTTKIKLKEKKKLEEDFAAYHLLMTCCHPNGVSYEIIKNKLPIINEEIAKILANIVEFEVFITNNDDKLDIFIKHPKYEARPLEMGSGAEKTIASMAIRLAFLTVTSLPKSDLFILDEPGTALDEENMEGFVRILEMIKGYFRTVILISHLDSLKDCVDMQINIEKVDNFAHVNI